MKSTTEAQVNTAVANNGLYSWSTTRPSMFTEDFLRIRNADVVVQGIF